MNTQRTIIIDIDTEQQIRMWRDTNEIEWCRAVGYLASWGRMYPRVKIFDDGEVNMVALEGAAGIMPRPIVTDAQRCSYRCPYYMDGPVLSLCRNE